LKVPVSGCDVGGLRVGVELSGIISFGRLERDVAMRLS
jgi:hypothetical protein